MFFQKNPVFHYTIERALPRCNSKTAFDRKIFRSVQQLGQKPKTIGFGTWSIWTAFLTEPGLRPHNEQSPQKVIETVSLIFSLPTNKLDPALKNQVQTIFSEGPQAQPFQAILLSRKSETKWNQSFHSKVEDTF